MWKNLDVASGFLVGMWLIRGVYAPQNYVRTLPKSAAWGRRPHTFTHPTHTQMPESALGEKETSLQLFILTSVWSDRTAPVSLHATLNCATAGFQESMTGSRSTTSSSKLLESLKWFRLVFQTGLKPKMNTCAILLILAIQIHADSVEGPTGKVSFVWRRCALVKLLFVLGTW